MSELKKVAKDGYLFRGGDPATAMYMIKSGGFVFVETFGYEETRLTEISVGEIIGELSLFDGQRHELSLKALEDSEVIVMPYVGINKQIEQLPQWAQALMKTMTDHMHKLVKYARAHVETPAGGTSSAHALTKYISILNLISLKQKKFLSTTVRDYTIQIFHEPTAKMTVLIDTLTRIGFLSQEVNEDGETEITNHKVQELVKFVDWYNTWLFKPEGQRLALLNAKEVEILEGVLHFAHKFKPNAKGFTRVNLTKIQQDSSLELDHVVRVEDVNTLVAKGYIAEPLLEDSGVIASFDAQELTELADHCKIINAFKDVMA